MTALTVDRLHARYLAERPVPVRALDACLSRVATAELARAVAEVPPLASPDAHVCVPALSVSLRLDAAGGVGSAACAWAREIATVLRRTLQDGTGVVRYRSTADALLDLVVSASRGDRGREWAWRQVGLVEPGHEGIDDDALVAAALVRHAALAPAALAAATRAVDVALGPSGWALVAEAVAALVGPPPVVPPGGAQPGGGADARNGDHEGTGAGAATRADAAAAPAGPAVRAHEARLAAGVARILEAPVTRQLPRPPASGGQRRALAVLAVLAEAPALARTPQVVAEVAAALAPAVPAAGRTAGETAALPLGASGPARPRGGRRHEQAAAGDEPPPSTLPADPAVPGEPPAALRSDVGGVLFLVNVVGSDEVGLGHLLAPGGALDRRTLPWLVARLGAELAGAPLDDPALKVLAGGDGDDAEPTPAEDAALRGAARDVDAGLRARLRLEKRDDLDWVWWRASTITREPGWIEATYDLDGVDVRIRRAGLDLDPGFVWWLGAVLRFRYV